MWVLQIHEKRHSEVRRMLTSPQCQKDVMTMSNVWRPILEQVFNELWMHV